MASRTLSVTITGDSKGAKDAFKDVEIAAGGIQGKLATLSAGMKSWGDSAVSLGKSISMNISLPVAALGAVAFRELAKSQQVAAQTNAVLASTGGAANVTAGQVDKLANSLMKKSGIDDEAIKSGENLLLTFTKIRNEAGRGNDVFNRATKAALDLSVAFGMDMHNAAIMLGKALNDPVAGLTAMGRAGVQFTAAQKDMIKGLVESGDMMGAQKIILKELETQVGGSAKAYGETLPGQIGRAKEALMNSSALILAAAAPAFEHLAAAAGKVAQFLASLPGPAREAIAAFSALAVVAGPVTLIAGKIAQGASLIVKGFSAIVASAETLAIRLMYAKEALIAFATNPYGLAIIATVTAITALSLALDDNGRANKRAAEEGKKYGQSLVDAATVAGGGLANLRQQLAALNTEASKANINSIQDVIRFGSAQGVVKGKIDEVKQAQHEARVAEEARNRELQRIASGTMDVADASDDAKNALQELQNAVLALSGGEIGYQQALINQEKAQRDLNTTLAQYPPESEEARVAQLNLDQANLQVASSALGLTDSVTKLKEIVGNETAYKTELARLEDIKRTHPEAAAAIQTQIDKLIWLHATIDGVPTSRGVTVTAETSDAQTKLNNILSTLNAIYFKAITGVSITANQFPGYAGAEGAIVSRPTIALIGEAGTEAVVPLHTAPGASALPSGTGPGATTITIPITLDGRVVTEVVVSNLNRAGGPKILQRAVI